MGKIRDAHKVLVGKLEEKKLHGRPRRRWEDIKINVKGIRWEGVKRYKPAHCTTERWALEKRQ
jgi:hypothetical protein